MKILAFDTSNNTCSVGITEGQQVLAYIEELRPAMQAERLVLMIEEALSIAALGYEEIKYLGITNGPGSFTGIRIGLAAAKGILLSTQIKGITVSNFAMAYYRARSQIGNYDKIFVLLNAYRNQLYLQQFDREGATGEPVLIDNEEAIELLTKEEKKIACTGNGIEVIYPQIKYLPNLIILPRFARIKALHICRYIDTLLQERKAGYTNSIVPLYIRLPDAKASCNR